MRSRRIAQLLAAVAVIGGAAAPSAAGNIGTAPSIAIFPDGITATGSSAFAFSPTADARVEQANPDANFGGSYLRADGGGDPDVESYLRFDVSGFSGNVHQATLRLYATTDTVDGPHLYGSDANWSESELTWNTRRAIAAMPTADSGVIVPGSWVSFDVTSLIQGTGSYSFALVTDSADGVNFDSREGINPPQLVVTTTGGGSSTDTQPPTTPSGLSLSGASAGSVSLAWQPSSDNLAVAGYDLYLNGTRVGATSATAYTFSNLGCGTSYMLGVDAYDAAGNRSQPASVLASTSACNDASAPTAPSLLWQTDAGATSISLAWSGSLDNVGVIGYGVYLDGSRVGSTSWTSFTLFGLACGRSYTVAVDAFDAAGNRSAQTSVVAATGPCAPAAATVVAAADTYASELNFDTPHGDYPYLRVMSAPVRNSYLRFDLSGFSGSVQQATLRLYATSDSPFGFDVHALADTSWLESTLTWSNAPAFASAISASSGPVNANSWVSVDVTSLVAGNGSVGFVLTSADPLGFYLASRETGVTAPQLLVTTTGGSSDTQAPTAPSGLSVAASGSGLSLSWGASSDNIGVTGYNVYLNGSRVGGSTTTAYTFGNLSCGTGYTVAVSAYDAAGNVSQLASLAASTAACAGAAATSCTLTIFPFNSLGAVLNAAVSGSTVCLSGGSYAGNFSVRSGASNVTLTAAPGAASVPVICGYVEVDPPTSYLTFSHLRFDGSCTTQNVLQIFGDHFTLQYSEVSGAHTSTSEDCVFVGYQANNWRASYDLFDHNLIHDCGSAGHGHGFYMDWASNATITNNYIYGDAGFGLQFYPDTDNSLFANNVVDGNGESPTYRGGLIFAGETPGLASDNDTVRDNIFSNNAGSALGSSWGDTVGGGNLASHNCFWNNAGTIAGQTGWSDQGGNVSANPLYTDAANHNYTLQAGSPCAAMGPSGHVGP